MESSATERLPTLRRRPARREPAPAPAVGVAAAAAAAVSVVSEDVDADADAVGVAVLLPKLKNPPLRGVEMNALP